MKFNVLLIPILALWASPLLSGCSVVAGNGGGVLSGASANGSGSSSPTPSATSAASVQSVSNPTAEGVVARIQNALPSVNPTAGNFKKALTQVSANLPVSPNPDLSTGLEQIPILVYGACSDVNPMTYQVNTSTSVAANQTNLVNAGMTMVNANLGGLASNATYSAQTTAVFNQLVAADITAGASTATTFISVCLAANSFTAGMVGF